MATDLDVLVPEGKRISIGGEDLTILPIKLKHLPVILKALRTFIDTAKTDAGVEKQDWLNIFAEHSDTLLEAMAIATGKPLSWVGDLDIDEGIEIATAVWEVNQNFFVDRVLPMLTRVLAGPTSSPVLSQAVTH